VIDEVSVLAAAGAREVTLLGQNVNAYHGASIDDGGLAGLIRSIGDISGIERIRYTTSHPHDLGEHLISAHSDVPQLMPCLHLPVQSGSDRVLGLMNRGHDVADYLRLVAALRQARPGIALSSDFIVGYPGETDADFDATMGLVREVDFAQAYSFKFSPRPGTPAAEITDQVPEAVKSKRLAALQALLNDRQLAFNRSWCGKIVPVLFDRRGRGGTQLAGRSPHMQAVHVDCPDDITADALFGTIADVLIEAASANSLTGVIKAPAKAIVPPQVMIEPAEA
jgi:tRNA-2-methylthio-N6-dimethylallyladenosine synthase